MESRNGIGSIMILMKEQGINGVKKDLVVQILIYE